MRKFKLDIPKGMHLLSRNDLKQIYGGSITDVNQFNCGSLAPAQITVCKGKAEHVSCSFSYPFYDFHKGTVSKTYYGSCHNRTNCGQLYCD